DSRGAAPSTPMAGTPSRRRPWAWAGPMKPVPAMAAAGGVIIFLLGSDGPPMVPPQGRPDDNHPQERAHGRHHRIAGRPELAPAGAAAPADPPRRRLLPGPPERRGRPAGPPQPPWH